SSFLLPRISCISPKFLFSVLETPVVATWLKVFFAILQETCSKYTVLAPNQQATYIRSLSKSCRRLVSISPPIAPSTLTSLPRQESIRLSPYAIMLSGTVLSFPEKSFATTGGSKIHPKHNTL